MTKIDKNASFEGISDRHERINEHVPHERRREGENRQDPAALPLLRGEALLGLVPSVLGRHDLR